MKTAITTRLVNSTSANRATISSRVFRWIAVDAVLGGAVGAVFGIVFGAFGLLLNSDSWSIVSVAGYFALCGAAAGAVVGACGAILEGGEVSDPAPLASQSTSPRIAFVTSDLDTTDTTDQANRRLPVNRLINPNRRGRQARQKPSRN